MLDVEISIEPLALKTGPKWRVEIRSTEPDARVKVDPITDADLATIAGLPADGRTWSGFLRLLSPGAPFLPSTAVLRDVGTLIMRRLFGDPAVVRHLGQIEARAQREQQQPRYLLEILEDDDPVLCRLPIELAFDADRFFFKRPRVPSIRRIPHSEAANLTLGRGARVLIATAHDDSEAEPTEAALLAHAEALGNAARAAGFEAEHLAGATPEALRKRLLDGPRVDVLYIACHGLEDRKRMGLLSLREAPLYGQELARMLEEATELDRRVQVAILCACSSAVPQVDTGTSGMAQWLVRPDRALAALGFRGPVAITWAFRWTERLFQRLGEGATLEEAFAFARYREPDDEPQWVLPLFYGRKRDLDAPRSARPLQARPSGLESMAVRAFPEGLPPLRALLPRQPRAYFTGRVPELETLRTWARTPGQAQITAVEGEGGIGKSELATVLAHEERAAGRTVVWLERADRDVSGAISTLISLAQPDFQAPPKATEDDLAATMRRLLGPYGGLLVLDDMKDRAHVDRLVPGGSWNVLVTTRIRGLLPGVLGVELRPLPPAEALRLLSQVAWNQDEPPSAERAGAQRLAERLGGLPLALELAGGTLRNLVTAEEYLASLTLGEGVAASDRDRVHGTLTRSLADLDEADEKVFLALGVLPASGVMAEQVAMTLGEPEGVIARRLDRLVRHHLAAWSPEAGRYGLHPLLREAARSRAKGKGEMWNELHRGAAEAIEALARWVYEPIGSRTDLAQERWARVSDIFDELDAASWIPDKAGGARVALALAQVDVFRRNRPLDERAAYLSTAEALAREDRGARRARVLKAQGDVRLRRGDMEGASKDYEQALSLYEAVEDHRGQATVLWARGDLRRRRDDLGGASKDYDQALSYFETLKSRLGQANVLWARGVLRQRLNDSEGANKDYEQALSLYEAVEDRLGQANVLQARGDMDAKRLNWSEARRWYDEAVPLYRTVRDAMGLSNVLVELAKIHAKEGQREAAEAAATEAMRLASACENRYARELACAVLNDLKKSEE